MKPFWNFGEQVQNTLIVFSIFQISSLCDWFDKNDQIVPWIFECASKLNFPVHAYYLAKWACEIYEGYRGWE